MRFNYSKAKGVRALRVTITVALAVLGLLLGHVSEAQQYLALFAWWTIFDQVLGAALEERFVAVAASIQEQFDVYVLGIQRNPRIPVQPPEEIVAANVRFRGDRHSLVDWYGATIPEKYGMLLCMRSNMNWDSRLRRTYAWLLVTVSAVWVVTVVLASLLLGSTVAELLLILAPSLPLAVQNANTAKLHFTLAASKEVLRNELLVTWRSALQGQTTVTNQTVRMLQDGIYAHRTTNALVPDLIYRYLRNCYNDFMIRATRQFQDEVAAGMTAHQEE